MDRSSRTFPPGYVEESAGGSTIGVAIAFIILEIAFFTLRLISRRLHQAKLGLDDILTVPSLIFCLAMCVLAIGKLDKSVAHSATNSMLPRFYSIRLTFLLFDTVGVRLCGIGRHLDVLIELEPRLLARWAKWAYATEQVYCVSVAFPKLSILASYLRVFTEKPYRVAVYVIGLITSLNAIVGVIVSLAACRPFSARWHSDGSGLSKCIDFGLYYRWIGFPNIITDVAILLLPLPVIWTLQISRNQKYGLSLVFLTGSM